MTNIIKTKNDDTKMQEINELKTRALAVTGMSEILLESGYLLGAKFYLTPDKKFEVVEFEGKKIFLYDCDLGLNGPFFHFIASKYTTAKLLESNGIGHIPCLLLPSSLKLATVAAMEYFEQHKKKFVIRGDRGICGDTTFFVESEEQIHKALTFITKLDIHPLISPYYSSEKEYRVIWLNGNIEFAVEKTINPKTGRHNLSSGAKAGYATPKKIEEMKDFAQKVANVFQINFGGIDTFETDEGFKVVEVSKPNVGIFSDASPIHKKMVLETYKKALKFGFEQL